MNHRRGRKDWAERGYCGEEEKTEQREREETAEMEKRLCREREETA